MFKKVLVAVTLIAASNAQAALNAGDIAFTSFNADEDGFSLVTFVDIAANTKIFFSDNEFVSGAFNTGESFSSWVSGASQIAAGTVIRFTSTDSATLLAASVGTFQRETVASSTNWGLSQSADTIYAYLGTSANAPTTFLTAISSGGFTAAEGSLTGTGLTVGVNATQLTNSSDYAEYTGVRSGLSSFAAYKSIVANNANWNIQGDVSAATTVPNTTAFAITAVVPEADTYAMLIAGLGLVGFASRRKA